MSALLPFKFSASGKNDATLDSFVTATPTVYVRAANALFDVIMHKVYCDKAMSLMFDRSSESKQKWRSERIFYKSLLIRLFTQQKIPRPNVLGTKLAGQTQRFYFDTKSGVILPGDTLKFPFVFKSPSAGIFTETWELMTRPTLCGGAPIRITLRGNEVCPLWVHVQRLFWNLCNKIRPKEVCKQAKWPISPELPWFL